MRTVSCAQARQIDLVDYLAWLGFHAFKIRGADYWYFSPFRKENTPSFKVDRSMNVWYDHGCGNGGNIIDFGIEYHRLPVGGFLQLLGQDYTSPAFSVGSPSVWGDGQSLVAGEKKRPKKGRIVVVDVRPIVQKSLLNYLQQRYIALDIASRYCREVDFMLYGKKHTAIGFPSDRGGYELRNPYFKGSSSPKAPTFFNNRSELVTVFEGFFNFLSYLTIEQDNPFATTNFLILNSLAFFQKATEMMDAHRQIDLMLDQDDAGIACTTQALKRHPYYRDESISYRGSKDLNDWLVHWRSKEKS